MQVNHFASLLKESKPKFLRYWKFFSFVVPFLIIFELARQSSVQLEVVLGSLRIYRLDFMFMALFLMPFNWGLEACKWYYLMRKFNLNISFRSSFKTTLTGLAYSLVLPGGIGEYIGRAEAIPSGAAWKGAGVLSIARIAQLYATIFFGGFTLTLFLLDKQYFWLLSGLIVMVMSFWLVFFNAARIARWLSSKFQNDYEFARNVLEPWEAKGNEKTIVFALSAIRYLVFTFQFYIILIALGVKGALVDLLSGISSAFMLKSFFPSFLDLGPRELAVTLFFENTNTPLAQVLLASLLLWSMNVMLPGLLGTILVFRNMILNARKK